MAIQTNRTLAIGSNVISPTNTLTGSLIYSETEQVVGTWIDGSPVHQKSFTGTLGSSTSGWNEIADLGSDSDKVVGLELYAYLPSYGQFVANYKSGLFVKILDHKVMVGVDSDFKSKDFWLTVRYTKAAQGE